MKFPRHRHTSSKSNQRSTGTRIRTAGIVALAGLWMGNLLTGCAVNRPVLTETTTTTNGTVTTKELRMTSFALWPATTSIDKQRGSVGKTLSVGTEQLEQETSSTNAAATLRELRLLLESVR